MTEPSDYAKETRVIETGNIYHTTPEGERVKLGPGDEFRPRFSQLGSESLMNKTRPTGRGGSSTHGVGADIGLRSLPMTDRALEIALDAGLDESDFENVDPAGANGDYLTRQVRAIIDEKEADE